MFVCSPCVYVCVRACSLQIVLLIVSRSMFWMHLFVFVALQLVPGVTPPSP